MPLHVLSQFPAQRLSQHLENVALTLTMPSTILCFMTSFSFLLLTDDRSRLLFSEPLLLRDMLSTPDERGREGRSEGEREGGREGEREGEREEWRERRESVRE